MRLFAFFLLLFPLVEIAGFIVVGGWIGVLGTLAALLGSAFIGILIVRIQGFGLIQRIRLQLDSGRVPGRDLAHGAMVAMAGLLFILPGFVSDILGLLFLLPPFRDLAWRFLARHVHVRPVGPGSGNRTPPRTIDLDPSEYGNPDSPWRSR